MGLNRKLGVTLALSFALLSVTDGQAQTDPNTAGSNPISSLGSTFDATKPPAFNAAASQGMANIFTSCIDPSAAMTAFGGLISTGGNPCAGLAAGFNVQTPCNGPEDAPDSSSLSCSRFQGANGQFDPTMMAGIQKAVNDASCTVTCKRAKTQAIQTELNCLTNQAKILQNQMASVQQNYQTNIQRMQQDINKVSGIEADRDQQLTDVTNKLQGNQQTGAGGLIALKQATQAMFAAMPAEIQGIKDAQHAQAVQAEQLEEEANQRKMSLASECFNTTSRSTFRCTPDGPAVSAKDYVICRYGQNAQLGANGKIESNSNVTARAQGGQANLSGLLDQMAGDSPSDTKVIPTSQQDATQGVDQTANKTVSVLTVADIENQFGDQLEGFNGNGLNIHDFVMQQYGYCFQKATAQVNTERDPNHKSSGLGIKQEALDAEAKTNSEHVNELLSKYSLQYQDDLTGLTGSNLPVDTSACTNATPDKQAACLDELKGNMEGLLKGSSKNSTMAINIAAQQPGDAITFSCQGLNGCITALQNVSTKLVAAKSSAESFKNQYIVAANASIDNFTRQMAATLGPQNDMLQKRLQTINTAMASLGISNLINIPNVQAEQMQQDSGFCANPPSSSGSSGGGGGGGGGAQQCLYKNPDNVVNLIGGKMNPPMMDLSGPNFAQAISGLGSGAADLNKQAGRIDAAKQQLASLATTCKAQAGQTALTSLSSAVNQFTGANCTSNGVCSAKAASSLQDAYNSLSNVGMSFSGSSGGSGGGTSISDIDDTLTAGISQCGSAGQSQQPSAGTTSGGTGAQQVTVNTNQGNKIQCDAIARNIANQARLVGNNGGGGNSAAGSAQ
jgi:hypothetical protein